MNKTTESCDSSVLHWASCTEHKNHVIERISACIPRTQCCFSINGPSKELRCSSALEHGDLYFSLHNIGVKILSPLYWMNEKNHRRQKKIWLKACTKPVIWWWKLWPGKQRVEERFKSTSQNYVIFFTNYILNSSLRSRLCTCQFFLIFTLKTIIASSYRKICREMRRVKMH